MECMKLTKEYCDNWDKIFASRSVMLKVNGKRWYCPFCGSNVLTQHGQDDKENHYTCNGCGEKWIGEK